MKPLTLILSCEHAVNRVPTRYTELFLNYQMELNSHFGIDFGSLEIATALHHQLPTAYFGQASVSRLVIDCNRSLRNRRCFSNITQCLPPSEKQQLIDNYYHPFRQGVINTIEQLIKQKKRVLHLSIHSFTPIWQGRERTTDLGLLYDPKRSTERLFAHRWQQLLAQSNPKLRVRLNYPYRGISDGFTRALRQQYSASEYLGIEVESNQTLSSTSLGRDLITKVLIHTLRELI